MACSFQGSLEDNDYLGWHSIKNMEKIHELIRKKDREFILVSILMNSEFYEIFLIFSSFGTLSRTSSITPVLTIILSVTT